MVFSLKVRLIQVYRVVTSEMSRSITVNKWTYQNRGATCVSLSLVDLIDCLNPIPWILLSKNTSETLKINGVLPSVVVKQNEVKFRSILSAQARCFK